MTTLNADCWQLILSCTNDPWTYKYTKLTCRLFMEIYETGLQHIVVRYDNQLTTLLYMFPDKPWNWASLINNPLIKKLFEFENPGINYDVYRIYNTHSDEWSSYKGWRCSGDNTSYWCSITELFDNIKIDRVWDYPKDPVITWEIMQTYPEIKWTCNMRSHVPNITMDIVLKNLHLSWDWFALRRRFNLSLQFLIDEVGLGWNHYAVSEHPELTWEFVQEHPEIEWSYWYLSRNPNITVSAIISRLDIRWEYCSISTNPGITWEDILANPEIHTKLDMFDLSRNSNITSEIIQTNPNPLGQSWWWGGLVCNPSIDMKFLRTSIETFDDIYHTSLWHNLPYRNDLDWTLIADFPDEPWNWSGLSQNNFDANKL